MKSIESILKVRRGINATDKELKEELIHELTDGYWWHGDNWPNMDFDPLLITYEVENCTDKELYDYRKHDHRSDWAWEDWIPISEDAKLLCEISQEKYIRGWVLDIVLKYYRPGADIVEVINVNIQE